MMKRLTALCLALLLLFSATAFAAGWEEGLSPNKPNEKVPEVNFDDTIGYQMYWPNGMMPAHYAKTLFIYLPREDATPNGEGGVYITIRSADPNVEDIKIATNDASCVHMRDITPYELEGLMWGGGKCIEIELPTSLRLDCTYYVDFDDRVIIDEAREVASPAFKSTDAENWHFELIADYGVSELTYIRNTNGAEEPVMQPAAGDTARFDLVIGGAAKSATVIPQGPITFSEAHVTESCSVEAAIDGDYPQWQVIFWDVEAAPANLEEQAEHIVDVLYF